MYNFQKGRNYPSDIGVHLSSIPVIKVEDDPSNINRVIVTDAHNNRANMTVKSAMRTCLFADNCILETSRIEWKTYNDWL